MSSVSIGLYRGLTVSRGRETIISKFVKQLQHANYLSRVG